MERIPTARELLNSYRKRELGLFNSDITEMMVEFAKLHVEAALLSASERAQVIVNEGSSVGAVSKTSILNAYPLNEIK